MACIACECYEKRITNVYRDEELKEKFEKIINYPILTDCFICDKCNDKLQELLSFQDNCIRVYRKNNPNYQQYEKSTVLQAPEVKQQNEYLILQADDVFTNEQNDEQYTVFEINTGDKEIEIEEVPATKKRKRRSERINSESPQKCLIVKDQIEETLIMDEEELLETTQDISYKVESLDESSQYDSKKPRKSYTVQQKLEIIEYSEQNSNREAARKYDLNESTVRCFKRQKDLLKQMDPSKSTNRHGTPYWPELEKELKEWAEKQSIKPKMNEVREEAIRIAKRIGCDNFSGSNTYIFKFMQRNNIEAASPRPRKKPKKELNE